MVIAKTLAGLVGLLGALSLSASDAMGGEQTDLFLDVTLNGTSRQTIAHFVSLDDGAVAAQKDELKSIGLNTEGFNDGLIRLSDIAGVTYKVDPVRQTVDIQATTAALLPMKLDLAPMRGSLPGSSRLGSGYGAVVNYDLFAASYSDLHRGSIGFNGATSTIEATSFTPFGSLHQSGIAGRTTVSSGAAALRLDTTWEFSDAEHATLYRAGDTISGGLAWTRPIRLGGLQIQKDYALRPDIVTLPLPSITGSAAVPSALNVYVNGVQTFTQSLPAGPYALTNIPAITGAGNTRVVLQDASGRQTQQDVPYFLTPKLLRQGLYDYSVEAGFARLDYGAASFSYNDRLAGSASGRYALTDWLTLEGHGEGTTALGNLGGGLNVRTGAFGVFSAAAAASQYGHERGELVYGAYQMQAFGLSFDLDTQRTLGSYRDLAAITAPSWPGGGVLKASSQLGYYDFGSVLPPLAIDRLSVGLPFDVWASSLNASVTHYVDGDHVRSRIASMTYSVRISVASVFLTILHDFDDKKGSAVLLGMSMPLGKELSASTQGSFGGDGFKAVTQMSKTSDLTPGSIGWNITDTEGVDAYRNASIDYRTPIGKVSAQASQSGTAVAASAEASGAFAFVPGANVHFGPRIDDSFVIVKAGAPDVPVAFQNRPVGVTGGDGELLVTGLRANDENFIEIDPTALPANASFGRTRAAVNPSNKTGAVVDFGVDPSTRQATVHFVDRDGHDIRPGTEGTMGETQFLVGYDGLASIKGLSGHDVAILLLPASECQALIEADPSKLMQTVGPVKCQ